jgi:hypothetical protein
MAAGIRNLIPQLAADKYPAGGNDAVFSTHQNVKKIPVTRRQERRSSDAARVTAAPMKMAARRQ